MSEMTRDEARAQVCKAVMGATRVAIQGFEMRILASQRTDDRGQFHVHAFGISGEGETEEIEFVVEVVVREPYRE